MANTNAAAFISISGLVAEYIVAIDVTRAQFPADAAVWLIRTGGLTGLLSNWTIFAKQTYVKTQHDLIIIQKLGHWQPQEYMFVSHTLYLIPANLLGHRQQNEKNNVKAVSYTD